MLPWACVSKETSRVRSVGVKLLAAVGAVEIGGPLQTVQTS